MFILTICTTGEGSAQLLKNVLDRQLDYHNAICETVALKLTDTNSLPARLESIRHIGKILCIVSTFHINLAVPHFGLTDVLQGNAVLEIQKLIDKENTFEEIGLTLANMLKNVNSKTILNDIRDTIQKIEVQTNRQLLSDVLIGVFCHVGCMIDRIIEKSPISEFPDKETYVKENKKLCDVVKSSCSVLETEFGISVPDDEICHIACFFAPENCVEKEQIR